MTRARAAAATVALVLAPVLAACGTTPTDPKAPPPSKAAGPAPAPSYTQAPPLPPGKGGTPRGPGLPDPSRIDQRDADAVGRAALTIMWTIDTTIDVSQHDATLRSLPLVTPQYAEQIKGTPPRSAPGADWAEWAAHHAYTTVQLQAADDAGRPADTTTEAYRTWIVTATPHGDPASWTGKPQTVTVFTHLTRPDAAQPWRVEAVRTY
ncbi:hypothetical protein ACIPW5_39050 [Streptomyces sp. NPDC090077]|uniref:hypothetical protein n=1 Tax=Streptomyces sp. NPDC090077 TaxID=3365938 RepID=UPI00381EB871